MSFHVGQKIVCVEGHDNPPASGGAKQGVIYTVREIGVTADGLFGVRLQEQKLSCGPGEVGYFTMRPFFDAYMRASRFRPIVENKSSVSFTIGADPESERWDGRRKKARERA